MSPRFTLHGSWVSGPTYKVGLALSLMGQPFAYRHVDLRGGEHKTPEFLAKNRFGQVPCLEDGDLALCQSAAILQYLAETTGRFGGGTPAEAARVREWLFWDFDKLAPAIYRARTIRLGIRQAGPEVVELYAGEGKAALGLLDGELAECPFLACGAPTIADIDAYGTVFFAEQGGFGLAAYPHLVAWMARIEALPGFGKPEALLPKESRA